MTCKLCGSHALNYSLHGRDGSFPDVCDVCYWRVRYEDRAAEIVKLRAELAAAKSKIDELTPDELSDGQRGGREGLNGEVYE